MLQLYIITNSFMGEKKQTEPLFGKENIPVKGRGHVLLQTNLFNSNQFSPLCQNNCGLIQASQNKLLTLSLLFWEIWSWVLANTTWIFGLYYRWGIFEPLPYYWLYKIETIFQHQWLSKCVTNVIKWITSTTDNTNSYIVIF